MANDKTAWEMILSAITGALGAESIGALVKIFREHAQRAVSDKAHALFADTGRPLLIRDIISLCNSSDAGDAEAGNRIRNFLIKARKEATNGGVNEADLINLLLKFPSDPPAERVAFLRGLGRTCPSYDEFVETMGILYHDNVMQLALKIASRLKTSGEGIIDDDIHAIEEAVGAGAKNIASVINAAAGAALPAAKQLLETLRKRRAR